MNSTTYGWDEYGNEAEDIRSGYVGEFKYFGFESVPPHCLACDGSEVSRETYSELFAVFGETFGAGDGTTTFNLPDFRGAFFRCIGGDAAVIGTVQSEQINTATLCFFMARARPSTDKFEDSHSASMQMPLINGGNNSFPFNANLSAEEGFYGYDEEGNCIGESGNPGDNIPEGGGIIATSNRLWVTQGAETRPVNYAVNVCVVYE